MYEDSHEDSYEGPCEGPCEGPRDNPHEDPREGPHESPQEAPREDPQGDPQEDPQEDPDELAGASDLLPVNTLARTFGRNVSLLRRAQHLSKRLLTDMAGISRPYLNEIEGGVADVRLSTVMRIGEALAVSPLILLCDLCPRDDGSAYLVGRGPEG